MKLATMRDSKSRAARLEGSSPSPGTVNLKTLAYITGVAIGDGNLSNPNGRAVRLRISCDLKYPNLIVKFSQAIKELLPNNKISFIPRKSRCLDISCYSNKWETWLNWKWDKGSKDAQSVTIPSWIKENNEFARRCVRGLFETDGSLYKDRGYLMANFVTIIPELAKDVVELITLFGFNARIYRIKTKRKTRYNIRISKDTEKFIEFFDLHKS